MPSEDFAYRRTSNAEPGAIEVIDNLEAVISQLSILDLEEGIQNQGTVSSTVLHLPVEILGEIFQHIVPGYLDINTKSTLANLCLVCKYWNCAARLTHRLWGRVSVTDDFVQHVSFSKIEAWLIRAKDAPRSLKIFSRDYRGPTFQDSQITQWLQPTTPLWQLLTQGPPLHHLSFSLSNPRCFESIVKSLNSSEAQKLTHRPWDSIRSLSLTFSVDWNDGAAFIFKNLPRSVTHLELDLPSAYLLCPGTHCRPSSG
ncbi:hypothetical protein H1R20_g15490, partial [Candolleomyces eurysporus]